jgi:transposase
MRDWLNTPRHWLVVERLPAYAPELNPVEGLWSSLKAVELANLTAHTPARQRLLAHVMLTVQLRTRVGLGCRQ